MLKICENSFLFFINKKNNLKVKIKFRNLNFFRKTNFEFGEVIAIFYLKAVCCQFH